MPLLPSRLTIGGLLLFLFAGTQVAASPKKIASGLFDNHLVDIQNIPSPTFGKVYSILRDRRGFLWFGTTNGLYKFDGYDIRVFDVQSRLVTAMVQTNDSLLLLATWKGLSTFNLKTEQLTPFLDSVQFGDGRVVAACEDSSNSLWIGTRTAGVFRYQRKTRIVRQYTTDNGLASNAVFALFVDQFGMVWVGTNHGLNSLDPATGKVNQYSLDPNNKRSLSSNQINCIDEVGQGLLFGTDNGLDILDRRSGKFVRRKITPGNDNQIYSITHDKAGRVWISVAGIRLFVYMDSSFTQFTLPPNGSDNGINPHVNTVYVDPTSNEEDILLWIGTRDEGVDKLHVRKSPFMNFQRERNLPGRGHGAMLSLCEDHESVLWVGLWGGGLNAFAKKDGKYTLIAHYANDPRNQFSLPNDNVNSIAEDHTGTIWVGTENGLGKFDRRHRRFVVFKHNNQDSTSLVANGVGGIFEDSADRLWICTDKGLSQLIRGKQERFVNYLNRPEDAHHSSSGNGGNVVSDIAEDNSSRLWVSRYGAGLNRLDDNGGYTRFVFPSDSDGTHESWIYDIHKDRNGTLWLGTAAGLVSFDPATKVFGKVPLKEFREAHIFDIADDANGILWLTTSMGLLRIDPLSATIKRFGKSEGLHFEEFLSEFCRTADGKLLVGGLDGFAEFYPDSITIAGTPAPVVITSFSIFDKPAPMSVLAESTINLSYDQNLFSFSFAALEYTDSKRNSYAYRMVGLDTGWVNAGHRNYASYTNMDPGAYTFEVKGANSDGIWNEASTSMRILIMPPYWRQWWFKFLLAGSLAGLAYGAYRYRLKKFLDMERLRLRIANDLHDDVGSNLSAIAMASRTAQRATELSQSTRQKLAEIYETAVQTSEGMKDLVWFIKPEDDTLDDLFLRMKDTASSLLGEVPFDFHAPKSGSAATVTIDFKRNVFLAFKEILSNTTKHAGANKVEIHIALHGRIFEMIIRDNGKGFDEIARHRGHGIQSLKKRALSIGGLCEIRSSPHQGTTVTFSGTM